MDESVLLVCAINNKEYGLFIKGTQYVDDMTPQNDVDLNGLVMKQVVTDKSGSPMLPAGEDGNVYDADTFEAINFRPILTCILNLKLNQMDK